MSSGFFCRINILLVLPFFSGCVSLGASLIDSNFLLSQLSSQSANQVAYSGIMTFAAQNATVSDVYGSSTVVASNDSTPVVSLTCFSGITCGVQVAPSFSLGAPVSCSISQSDFFSDMRSRSGSFTETIGSDCTYSVQFRDPDTTSQAYTICTQATFSDQSSQSACVHVSITGGNIATLDATVGGTITSYGAYCVESGYTANSGCFTIGNANIGIFDFFYPMDSTLQNLDTLYSDGRNPLFFVYNSSLPSFATYSMQGNITFDGSNVDYLSFNRLSDPPLFIPDSGQIWQFFVINPN